MVAYAAYTSGILFDTNSVAIDIKYDVENAVKFPTKQNLLYRNGLAFLNTTIP